MIDYSEIPEKIHNIPLSEENRKRLAKGLPSNLVRDIVFEDGQIINAKLFAVKNNKGRIDIGYEEQEESIRTPSKIFDQVLSEAQKNELWEGRSLGPLSYKGNDYFIHIDEQLKKVVVRNTNHFGIPSKVGNYSLDAVDKHMLTNGKTTQTRVFESPDGGYFTANLGVTDKKDGVEFLNIKFIQKENAPDIIEKLNKSSVIKDETRLLNMVGIPVKSSVIEKNVSAPSVLGDSFRVDVPKYKESKEITLIHKSHLSQVQYKSVIGKKDSVEFNPNGSFVPNHIKGVKLTEDQKIKLKKNEPIKLKGMKLTSGKHDGVVMLDKRGGIKFDFSTFKKNSKALTKEKDIDKDVEYSK